VSSAPDPECDTVVVSRTEAADGVVIIELAAATGQTLPGWRPGAHIDVDLPNGLVRQYSLCGPIDSSTWRIGVLREPNGRGGSEWLHDSLAVGDTLRIRGPRNHFAFEPAADTRYVFIAGGIGITPITPMLEAAKAAGVDYRLEYLGRSVSTMALAAELSNEHGDRVTIHAADEGNRLDLASLFDSLEQDVAIYCCGPTRLIDAVESLAAGHPLHVERFEAKELGEPVLHESFQVELASTGITVTVPPDRSILSIVEEAGVLVLSSCQEGTCGTCETVIIDGDVDHRDSILTPAEQAENRIMYICVSRAACPRLVLDL
jgi:ferredoxin-NADP reductase